MKKTTTEKYKCKICNNYCAYCGLHLHLKNHKITLKEYYVLYDGEKEKYNNGCIEIRKKSSPKCIEFYISRGLSIAEATKKLQEHKTLVKNITAETDKLYNPIAKSYWKHRGYSNDEIKEILSKRNSHGLDFFINKHGNEKGPVKYKEYRSKVGRAISNETRIKKLISLGYTEDEAREIQRKNHAHGPTQLHYWINRGYATNNEEAKKLVFNYSCINSKRRIEYWMFHHGYTEDEAKIAVSKHQNRGCVKFGAASKWSMNFIKKIVSFCLDNNISYNSILYGGDGKTEKHLYCSILKRNCFYDLCIEELNLIIEFHGEKFHPYPLMEENERFKWKSLYSKRSFNDVLKFDNEKRQIAEKNGYKVLELWQRTEDINFNNIMKEVEKIIDERKNI